MKNTMNLDKYYEWGFDKPLFPKNEPITSADITASTLPMQFGKAINLLTTAEILKGDVDGHPFHGNQYRDGEGNADEKPHLRYIASATADFFDNGGKIRVFDPNQLTEADKKAFQQEAVMANRQYKTLLERNFEIQREQRPMVNNEYPFNVIPEKQEQYDKLSQELDSVRQEMDSYSLYSRALSSCLRAETDNTKLYVAYDNDGNPQGLLLSKQNTTNNSEEALTSIGDMKHVGTALMYVHAVDTAERGVGIRSEQWGDSKGYHELIGRTLTSVKDGTSSKWTKAQVSEIAALDIPNAVITKAFIQKGDLPGHKFRGNQYRDGEGENRNDELLGRIRAAGADLGVHENPRLDFMEINGQDDVPVTGRDLVKYGYENLTDEQRNGIAKTFSDAAKASYPVVNVSASVLTQILSDGRFKTQFETGGSRGLFSPEWRAKSENEMFGYSQTDTPAEIRPVYGILATVDPEQGEDQSCFNAHFYGEISVVLKDDVKDRTTYTQSDSLGSTMTPALVNETDPIKVLMAQKIPNKADAEMQSRDLPKIASGEVTPSQFLEKNIGAYAEAQIHGGITLQDISKVVLPKNYNAPQEVLNLGINTRIKALIDGLNEAGITYTFRP